MWRSLYGAVCCSMVQCVAVWRSALQRVAVCVAVSSGGWGTSRVCQCVAVCCSGLQYVAACCSSLKRVLRAGRSLLFSLFSRSLFCRELVTRVCIYVCMYTLMYVCMYICTSMSPLEQGCSTGWRRFRECLKLLVSSAKRPLITGLFCGQ